MHLLSWDADLQICPDLLEEKPLQNLQDFQIVLSLSQNFSAHFAFNIVKTETRSGDKTQGKNKLCCLWVFLWGYSSLIGKGMCLSLFENCVMQFFTDTIAEYLSHSTKKLLKRSAKTKKRHQWQRQKKKSFYTFNQLFLRILFKLSLPPSFFLICICQQLTNCIAKETFYFYTLCSVTLKIQTYLVYFLTICYK